MNGKKLIVIGVPLTVFLVLLISANPLLLAGINTFDATHSGGRASSTGVSASTGGGDSGGSGGRLTQGTESVFFDIELKSIDVTKNNSGIMSFGWNTTRTLTVDNFNVLGDKIDFEPIPSRIKPTVLEGKDQEFRFDIIKPLDFGVHQVPVVMDVMHDGYPYTITFYVTLDNTGLFILFDFLRDLTGQPVYNVETV